MRRRGLLPALILMLMAMARGVSCHGGHHLAAAWVVVPRRARMLSRWRHCSASTRNLSSRLFDSSSADKTYGPAISRAEAPTHLDFVEDAVHSALEHYNQRVDSGSIGASSNILDLPPERREAVGVASHLQKRLRGLQTNGDCRRCWLQKAHCVCERCVPLEDEGGGGIPKVQRLFLLTHHKEICLAVDTAKLILASFPYTARLVVAGLGRKHQPSMGEMLDAASDAANGVNGRKCLILFPAEDAMTFEDIEMEIGNGETSNGGEANDIGSSGWDVVVIDGTWSQARKLHAKHFGESAGNLFRVRLGDETVRALDRSPGGTALGDGVDERNGIAGHQLRRHPIKWREISTLEATRLLLDDVHHNGEFAGQSEATARYHEAGNEAARRQLGPPRIR